MSESLVKDAPRLLLCDCEGSMTLGADALGKACGASAASPATHLCRRQIDRFQSALEAGEDVIVACGQEAPLFQELAEEVGVSGQLTCVDIRDRAGWSDDTADAGPKMAALLAESRVEGPPTPGIALSSEGVCLIYGASGVAFEAARALSGQLGVTVLLPEPDADAIPPVTRDWLIASGRISAAHGWLGAFSVSVDGFAEAEPAGRGSLRFGTPRDGGQSDCDLILDLSGGAPLFPAHKKRDGYLRADPGDPAAAARAMLEAAQYVGDFEKPLYIDFDAQLCAHTRSGQPGCDRCLQVCPTSAIAPDGDVVRIDPHICAGCGACAAVCPSGAAAYAYPEPSVIWRRMEALFDGWRAAGGGGDMGLVFHDAAGLELIAASARFGRGLPARHVPFAVNQTTQAGHDAMLSALAMGAAEVVVLLDPVKRDEAEHLVAQVALANALASGAGLGEGRVRLVETNDPDALEDALWRDAPPATGVEPVIPIGDRRSATRTAMLALTAAGGGEAQEIPLPVDLFPSGPPYGSVEVNTDACTLCLACASTCPAGALLDSPDKPQLRFHESACLQCGICARTCPEDAIELAPRYLLTEDATRAVVKNEEEPFACIECGKPFGVKSTVERIGEKLVGKHWMFADDSRAKLIQMCDDCRIKAQYHAEDSPFRMGERPKVRTTEDYISGALGDDEPTKH